MEKGPSDDHDHDEPHRFELPTNEHVMRATQATQAWIHRLARYRRDEDDLHSAA